MKPVDVTIVGGGMITNDLILPSIYHLQRTGVINEIAVCALNTSPLKALKDSAELRAAFPGQDFTAYPGMENPLDAAFPDLFKEVLAKMKPHQAVVVAMPDQLHYSVIMEAFKSRQHVLCVKPLVLKYEQAVEVEKLGKEKGLFCGVEYHKRFDTRALMAKRHYEEGHFGSFVMGEAKMIEPYFYRHSNFQNWFTCDKTDPFVYVGCHYVDLVCFITGLKPVSVSVSGIKGRFPNGNEGYMWANGRVVFENGAILSVTDGLGYPDDGAGSNEQCLSMFFEGDVKSGALKHDDQFRGVCHSYLGGIGCAGCVKCSRGWRGVLQVACTRRVRRQATSMRSGKENHANATPPSLDPIFGLLLSFELDIAHTRHQGIFLERPPVQFCSGPFMFLA